MVSGLVYLAFAALSFGAAGWYHRRVYAKSKWPTTLGKLVERGVARAPNGYFTAVVKYRFVVGGKEHDGDTLWALATTTRRQAVMRQIVDKLPDPVTVHYDPADPQRSFLVVNPRGYFWLLIGVGALAALMSVVWLVDALAK